MTKTQQRALDWLRKQGGDGVFDKTRVLVAGGERLSSETGPAGFTYTTWLALEKAGHVQFYGGKSGRSRVKVTAHA